MVLQFPRTPDDGSGMRVKKIESGKTVYYVYSGNDPVIEYFATDGKYTYYIYAGKKTIAEETDGVVKFYHKDHLGSTKAMTDASGNKVAQYTYEPFGEVTAGGDGQQRFTGKEQDTTGLYYSEPGSMTRRPGGLLTKTQPRSD